MNDAETTRGIPDTCPHGAGAGNVEDLRRVGRYRIVSQLGAGAASVVYKAYDESLRREVAVKVPRPELLAVPSTWKLFMREARILASLDHPGILPIYDVGQTEAGLCYLVCKLYAGDTLRTRMASGHLPIEDTLNLVIQVAESLAYAHQHGLIHRDVKPENILLDRANRAVLADFELALKESQVGSGPAFVGTRAYMSPEQARREGHLVDPRTDVFSLGVVLYELLAERRPFESESPAALLELIQTRTPVPLRRKGLPRELDQICARALEKRPQDRYATAQELADELRDWLRQVREHRANLSPTAPRGPAKIVCRGLLPFGPEDADFFLALLPGGRDTQGLPESIGFWKHKLDCRAPDRTFRVGVLAGPAGTGKTSFVRAGLLPSLAAGVVCVYVEASFQNTEDELLEALRQHFSLLPTDLSLAQSLSLLRRDEEVARDRKVVLVLDQFEEWLAVPRSGDEQASGVLGQALRECDGGQVQCLLVMRDDFCSAAGRFLDRLGLPLVEQHDLGKIDYFDRAHARKVLRMLGAAHGVLPEEGTPLTAAAEQFLDLIVAAMTPYGRVAVVNLQLFVEKLRERPWLPESLNVANGSEHFIVLLFETYVGQSGHGSAARAVLQALLPPLNVHLKRFSIGRGQLLGISGYEHQPAQFELLMALLERSMKIVTPADPLQISLGQWARGAAETPGQVHYQITHDYLLPTIRTWLQVDR